MKNIHLAALGIAALLFSTVSAIDKTLKFNANGKFKMVQFTDIHFGEDYDDDLKNQ